MSWTTWSSTGAHLPAVVANPAVAAPMQTGMLPAGINSAPAAAPPGVQYSAEQWAQVQQQNWQQWAQWQQQYQQWHQQYGAEYQKSLNAIANGLPTPVASLPNINAAVPPPLPNDNQLIAPPEELGRSASSLLGNAPVYNTMPPKVSLGYNTAPQQQFNNIPQQNQIGIIRPNWNANKRSLNIGDYTSNKRQMTDNLNKTGNSVQQKNIQWQVQPSTQSSAITPHKMPGNLEELSEAEKKFDKEFAAWEAQFNKWKEQNISHPDKIQYREYEKKWESWRNSLLERREQMRKKRQAMQALVVNGCKQTFPQQMDDKQPLLSEPYPHADLFNKPPPTPNSDPSIFKPDIPGQVEENTFLKLSTTCEIPGLDLVKDNEEPSEVQTPTDEVKKQETIITESKGPDLDAISKGIKSILGDQKLLSMLSLVSQNQNLMKQALPDTSTKPPGYGEAYKVSSNIYNEPPPNQLMKYSDTPRKTGYDDHREPRETVNNFDDQTCMSFPRNGSTEQEICYNTQENFNTNQNRFPARNESSVRFEVPPPENNYSIGSEGLNNKFGRFNEGSKRDDRNSYNNYGMQTRDKTNQATQYNSNLFDNCKDNFSKSNFNNRNQLQEQYTEDQYDKCYKRYEVLNHKNNCGYDNSYISSQKDKCNEEKWKEEKDFEKYHEMFSENDKKSVPSELVQAPEAPHLTPQEDDLFEPQIVIDYEHKLIKPMEAEVMLEPVYMFDYRHKALNRIPYPQRPKWLSEVVKNIRQFDPLAARISLERPKSFDSQSVFNRTRDAERFPFERRQDLREEKYSKRPQLQDRNADRYKEYVNDRKCYRDTDRDTRYNDRSKINERSPVEKNKYFKEHRDEFEELSDDEWIDNDEGEVTNQITCDMSRSTHPVSSISKQQISMVEDLINPPGRYSRPPRIVIILRGPSGSGKTYLAKLIKDKEVECGGSAPRILSLDDYFMVEQEKETVEDGKKSRVKEMVYEYEPEMLDAYRQSFIKSFKKTVIDGYFPFIIVDNINDKVKYFGEMWSFAIQKGFQVYICQLDLDPQLCMKRNVHHRTLQEIEECIAGWEPTPPHHPQIDATTFLQTTITEVEMEDETPSEVVMEGRPEDEGRSKWDTFDCSLSNLAKLDGVSKPLRPSRTMEEYLQLDDGWEESRPSKPGQKRVRWADLEEQKHQAKMRAVGFVVGHTNWDRMMDPTFGGSALTQTKYI